RVISSSALSSCSRAGRWHCSPRASCSWSGSSAGPSTTTSTSRSTGSAGSASGPFSARRSSRWRGWKPSVPSSCISGSLSCSRRPSSTCAMGLRHDPQVQLDDCYARAMDTFPDLGSLSDQELKDLIQQLTDEEQEVSYRRRILHGKIDILRAELVNRLRKKHEGGEDVISGADVQRLTDILAGRASSDDDV